MSTSFLYKYIDHHAVDVLKDFRLKVTPPKEFNDPFEFLPHIKATMTVGKAKRKLKEKGTQEMLYENWTRFEGYADTFREFKQKLASGRDHFAKLMVERFSTNLETYREKYQDSVSRDHGVLCLSKTPASILMWSHYADSHKGAVIALKADHSFFTESAINEVDYKDERVAFDPTWSECSPDFQKYAGAIIRRKSSHWSYEEELRMLFQLSFCKPIQKDGRRIYFYEIPPDLIAKVIFGLRCPAKFRKELKDVAQHKGLQIQFEEVRHHDSQFGLTFHPA